MRKPRIYLDTSVISYLNREDAPDKMNDTLKLWKDIKSDLYEVFISDITIEEIMRCSEPKRSLLLDYMNMIEQKIITVDDEINAIARQFIDNHILKAKNIDDCRHIACAIVSECDYMVSWNFKHIVNVKTIKGMKIVSAITGYGEVAIYTPTFLVEGED